MKNRCPTTAVQHMTPHQAWHGQRPDLHSLRVFGCVAHLHIPEQSSDRTNNLSARSVPCINVGYSARKPTCCTIHALAVSTRQKM